MIDIKIFNESFSIERMTVLQNIFIKKDIRRKDVYSYLLDSKRIRNRIAHYEILIKNKNVLNGYVETILTLLDLIEPELLIVKIEKENIKKLLGKLELM